MLSGIIIIMLLRIVYVESLSGFQTFLYKNPLGLVPVLKVSKPFQKYGMSLVFFLFYLY